jgi:hypothetical protein
MRGCLDVSGGVTILRGAAPGGTAVMVDPRLACVRRA